MPLCNVVDRPCLLALRTPFVWSASCFGAVQQTVFEKFADFRFKRIVCVDEDLRCKGIISVSDLLNYFL